MNDFLNQVANYLDGLSIGSNDDADRTIFVGRLPADPDACVALLGLPGTTIGNAREVATLQFPRFQVITRAATYDDASDKLQAVRTALHNKYGLIFANWRVMRCHAEQEGGPIGADGQNRFEFAINFAAEINAQTA